MKLLTYNRNRGVYSRYLEKQRKAKVLQLSEQIGLNLCNFRAFRLACDMQTLNQYSV